MHEARICKGCWDQVGVPIPIRGPLALPLRALGITRSKMNPNICTICERAFRRVKKRSHLAVQASILFADIRGYTQLSERIGATELHEIVGTFHDHCARGIWAHDGIVNRQMGDGLMAIFNFPINAANHAQAAVLAALALQQHCKAAFGALGARLDVPVPELGIGVGVHTGAVEVGEFSTTRSDFTAIGSTVNLAARMESAAAAGEIVLSAETASLVPTIAAGATERSLSLKGFARPVPVVVLSPAACELPA